MANDTKIKKWLLKKRKKQFSSKDQIMGIAKTKQECGYKNSS